MTAQALDKIQSSPTNSPVRLLITGASGFVGRNLVDHFRRHYQVTALLHRQSIKLPGVATHYGDINNASQLCELFACVKPDVVIHTAANKNVRQCEKDPHAAYAINALGTKAVAQACQEVGSRLLYLSTDLVFKCEHGGYTENDMPEPATVYGKTKLEGEYLAQQQLQEVVIVRSGGLYGPHSPLIHWAKQQLARGKVLEAYTDVVNTPTYVCDLAQHLERLLQQRQGVFHVSGPEAVSRYAFFKTFAKVFGLDDTLIRPVQAGEKRRQLLLQANASLASKWIKQSGLPGCQSLVDGFQSLSRETVLS